jgi:hypothetical protein
MKNTANTFITGFFLLLIFGAGLAFADEPLGKDALESAIKGNTAEGKFLNWGTTYKMFFDPSGQFRRIDSRNNKESGAWSIDAKGVLLMSGRKDRYRTVKQRKDGGYDVYNKAGKVVWTMDKLVPGNPYNL